MTGFGLWLWLVGIAIAAATLHEIGRVLDDFLSGGAGRQPR